MKKLIALTASCLLATGAAFAADYVDISIQDLDAAIKAGKVTVIDVNGSESYASKGHIPGAIDFVAGQEKLPTLLPQDKGQLVVAYCGSSMCTAYKKAADAATQLGFTNVKHLSAGIKGWIEAGMAVEKSEKKEGCPDGSCSVKGGCPAKSDCEKKN